ncbi:MAG: hypothetical protein ACRDYA_02005 [Egibacteraceae bacterium]
MIALLVALLMIAFTGVVSAAQVDLRAQLTGNAINGVQPRGEARFREDQGRREFRTTVQDVNLPAGTELDVAVEGTTVGTIVLEDNNDGELRLGRQVPAMEAGDTVTVAKPDGTVILSGQLRPN